MARLLPVTPDRKNHQYEECIMTPNRLLNRCTKAALAALLVGSMTYTSRAQDPGTSDKVPRQNGGPESEKPPRTPMK
jgi:hypothetical protein